MTTVFSIKRFIVALLVGAMAVISGLYAPLFLVIVAAAIGCMGTAWGISYTVVAYFIALSGLTIVYISDPFTLCCLVGVFLIGSLILLLGFRHGLPYRLIAVLLALIILIGIYMYYCVPELLQGNAPYAGITEYFKTMDEIYTTYYNVEESEFGLLAAAVPSSIYGAFLLISELLALIGVAVCKKFCTLSKAVVRPMARLHDWQIPSNLKFGLPILAVSCIGFAVADYRGTETIALTLLGLIGPLLFIQGFSWAAFMLLNNPRSMKFGTNRAKVASPFRSAYILLFIFAWVFPFAFLLLGVVELYVNMRPRLRRINNKIRKAFQIAEHEKRDTVTVDLDDGRGPQIIAIRKRNQEGVFFDNEIKNDADIEKNSDDINAPSAHVEKDEDKTDENNTEDDTKN